MQIKQVIRKLIKMKDHELPSFFLFSVCRFSRLAFEIETAVFTHFVKINCSQVPFTQIDRGVQNDIWPVIKEWNHVVDSYELVHSYGLFRR